jgi:hypothetical protein
MFPAWGTVRAASPAQKITSRGQPPASPPSDGRKER